MISIKKIKTVMDAVRNMDSTKKLKERVSGIEKKIFIIEIKNHRKIQILFNNFAFIM